MQRSDRERGKGPESASNRARRSTPARSAAGAKAKTNSRATTARPAADSPQTAAKPDARQPRKAAALLRAVTADDIRLRAYEIFLRRGGGHGRDLEDWLQAERELRALHKID